MGRLFHSPAIVVVGFAIGLLAWAGPIDVAGPVSILWGLACGFSVFRTKPSAAPAARRVKRVAGSAILLITAGTAVRAAHGLAIGSDPPLVSPADLLHAPGYLLVIYLSWFLLHSRIERRDGDAWLDAAAIALVMSIVLWTTVLGDFILNSGLGFSSSALNSFYNTAALVALVIVLRISATPGARPRAYYLVGFGYSIAFAADMAASVSLATDRNITISISLYQIAVGFLTYGLNHPTAHELTRRHEESEERVSLWRVSVVGLAVISPVVLLFAPDDIMIQVVSATLTILLASVVGARIISLLKKHERYAEMDRQLALEIAKLSQTLDPLEIQQQIPGALDRIVGPGELDYRAGDQLSPDYSSLSYSFRDERGVGPEVRRVVKTLIREADLLATAAESDAKHKRELLKLELERGAMRNERKHHALAQNASDAVFVLDLNGVVTYASPSVEGMSGWRPDEYLDRTLQWCVHLNDQRDGLQAFANVVRNSVTHHIELRAITKEGDPLLMDCLITDMRDVEDVEGIVINVTDITAKRLLESNLRNAELFDPLTLLFNRNTFIGEVTTALRSTTFNQSGVVVAVINIDEFRILNEGMGSEIGDHVLIETAARIRRHLRVGDMVARLSGDEFGVLMSVENDPEQLADPIDRILAAVAEPMEIDGHEFSIQATAGLAIDTDGSTTGLQLITNADTAVDAAKETQRGSVVIFDDAMGQEMSRRMRIRNRLGRAIENDELRLVYQPISDMTTGEIVSLEALARWTDPELGVVTPNVFVNVAERTGVIFELGDWALRSACSQIVSWNKAGMSGFSVSVNMSADQLKSPDVVKHLEKTISEFGIDPNRLTIEITESMLLDDTDLVSGRIQEIRALGLQLSIDDFGTGYSSLSYLRKYEFDVLKIDRGFVIPLGDNGNNRDRQIVKNMITLAQDLDAVTVAEGIESQAEFDTLVALGCDRAQGYLLWKPLEVDAVTETLRQRKTAKQIAS